MTPEFNPFTHKEARSMYNAYFAFGEIIKNLVGDTDEGKRALLKLKESADLAVAGTIRKYPPFPQKEDNNHHGPSL